jgi:hypothetical protein
MAFQIVLDAGEGGGFAGLDGVELVLREGAGLKASRVQGWAAAKAGRVNGAAAAAASRLRRGRRRSDTGGIFLALAG